MAIIYEDGFLLEPREFKEVFKYLGLSDSFKICDKKEYPKVAELFGLQIVISPNKTKSHTLKYPKY